jgi:hypothetical protein
MVMDAILSNIVVINVRRSIERSTRKSAKYGRKNCMTMIYSRSPTALIVGNVHSASCRCRLIQKNLYFFHVAAKKFAMAVSMLMKAMAETGAHSVESWCQMMKNSTRE